MVASGVAGEPVTVGLALLASGVGLNVILNKALERFGAIMGSVPAGLELDGKDAGHSLPPPKSTA